MLCNLLISIAIFNKISKQVIFITYILAHILQGLPCRQAATLINGSRTQRLRQSLGNSVEITNKMQPCNRIYYSTVHWWLNMFRAAYRSSSGAPTLFAASGLHTHVVTGRSQVWVGTHFPLRLDYDRSPHAYVNQRLQIQLELLMTSGMPLETCWAFNEQWNNKFCYKVASCWLFLLNHTTMHGSMNIKFIKV